MTEEVKEANEHLNKDAKEYIPTKKRIPKKIDFNLLAKEYRPKQAVEYIEADEDEEDEDEDDEVNEKMDMIVKDMVEEEVMEELGNYRQNSKANGLTTYFDTKK